MSVEYVLYGIHFPHIAIKIAPAMNVLKDLLPLDLDLRFVEFLLDLLEPPDLQSQSTPQGTERPTMPCQSRSTRSKTSSVDF
jgi:hypothetical protein